MLRWSGRQDKFRYTDEELLAIRRSLTEERLTPYLDKCGKRIKPAVKLYERNAEIAASLYIPLQGLEILLRNAFDSQLGAEFQRPDWYDSGFLTGPQARQLQKAKDVLLNKKKPVTAGRIVAELPFGFWVGLTGKSYAKQGLFNRVLSKAFPNAPVQRKEVHRLLDVIRLLRNRVAHHEPIFARDLEQDYRNIVMVAGWICEDTCRWIEATSGFEKAIAPDWRSRFRRIPF